MPGSQLQAPLIPPGSPWQGALLFCVAIIAPVLAYFGARFTATAPLQASLNDAFRSVVAELQAERAQHIARILELESEVLRYRGTVNQGLAREAAMQRRLEKLEGK